MSLPLYLLEPGRLAALGVGDDLLLDGPEGRHAATVRRTRAGERLRVADGAGACATTEVVGVEGSGLRLRVLDLDTEPEPDPRLVLVQALAKGDRDEQAVEAATECGVDEIVPWQAERSVVRWRGERGERSWRAWDQLLVAATKQSRRTRRPALAPTASTADVVARIARSAAAYVLHEEASTPLATCALPSSGDVLVVVGPEGGISPAELARLTDAGGMPVRLGHTVLRASSAGPAALAVISADARWR